MKNKFKLVFSFIVVFVFAFLLLGCKPSTEGGNENEGGENEGGNENQGGENEGGNENQGGEEKENLKEKYNCISIEEAIQIAMQSGENGSAESYYIYGMVKSVSNATYGEMTITDGTNDLYIYGTTDEEGVLYGSWTTEKPVAGDEVVIYGILKTYNDTPEMGRSIIKDFNHIIPEVDENEYATMSVKESRLAAEGTKMKLTGVVATITNAFGMNPNGFYLVDNTGSIYVYGSDVAQQVTVGNIVTIAAEKTYYINPDEATNAAKFGYEGACQVQKPILLDNDKQNSPIDFRWVKESTVKDIIDTEMTNNITSDIFKVTALIKKVPGSGFVNYYINDLDGKTGSYVYTMCNGSDFDWLDRYDGEICTVYLSPINCKSTASGTIYRFIPVSVKNEGFTFDVANACSFALKYYAEGQFKELYKSNPKLELVTSVSSELLGINNVALSYASDNTNVVYFENNIMHTKDDGKAKITVTATFGSYTETLELTIEVKNAEDVETMTVKEASEVADGTKVVVKGIVAASLVNQTGFYIVDETGIISVTCAADVLQEVSLGNEVVIEGTKGHRKKDPNGAYAGQIELANSKVVVNYYGSHDYSKASFISGKTLKDIYDLDYTKDHSCSVYIVTGKIVFTGDNYSTTVKVVSEDGATTLSLYMSSSKQYNWLSEFDGQVVTLEIAPCNWNGKTYYRGCILSASNGEKTLVNTCNFNK